MDDENFALYFGVVVFVVDNVDFDFDFNVVFIDANHEVVLVLVGDVVVFAQTVLYLAFI